MYAGATRKNLTFSAKYAAFYRVHKLHGVAQLARRLRNLRNSNSEFEADD
jgi:hypothetical protein